MNLGVRLGAPLLLLAGCAEAGPVPGWQRATERKPSPVPYTEPLVNEVVALGNGRWRFNGAQIGESELLYLANAGAALKPRPILLVDFSRLASPSEKRRVMIAIAETAGCTGEFPPCIEGTRAEYDRF